MHMTTMNEPSINFEELKEIMVQVEREKGSGEIAN